MVQNPYHLKKNEKAVAVRPVGIQYECEFCHEGNMVFRPGDHPMIQMEQLQPQLYTHVCDKCGKTLQLPRVYPFIAWIDDDQPIPNGFITESGEE